MSMIASEMTTTKKTKGDSAEPLCWRFDVTISVLRPKIGSRIDLDQVTPPTLPHTADESIVEDDDGNTSNSRRRTWSQAFEDESENAIIPKRCAFN